MFLLLRNGFSILLAINVILMLTRCGKLGAIRSTTKTFKKMTEHRKEGRDSPEQNFEEDKIYSQRLDLLFLDFFFFCFSFMPMCLFLSFLLCFSLSLYFPPFLPSLSLPPFFPFTFFLKYLMAFGSLNSQSNPALRWVTYTLNLSPSNLVLWPRVC